mgnify:CR=1 FL=1
MVAAGGLCAVLALLLAAPGASLVIKALSVRNAGATRRELGAAELADGAALPEVARLRGYVYDEAEVAELSVSAGAHVVDGAPTSRPAGGMGAESP